MDQMEIQEIGPAYTDPTFPYPKSKPPSTPTQNALKISEFPPRRALHSLPKIKKYANRPRILEHHSVLPYEKKKISIPSVNQLSKKKLLEAEILVDDIENPNLLYLLAKAFKRLESAKKVTLKLSGYGELNLPAIQWLVRSLSQLKSLTSLTLHLPYHPKCKDGDYIKLLKSFAKNQHLENFELVIHIRYGVKSSIVSRLHDALAKIKTLKKVSLNLALSEYVYRVKNSILQRGLDPRIEDLGNEKLVFAMQVPYSLDRQDLVSSLESITNFNSLRSLKLDFSSFIQRLDGRIDDQITAGLLLLLARHQNLVHLDLSFVMSWYLEDTHVSCLVKAISKLKNLKYLRLDFASCYGITDESVKDTTKALYVLPNLEQVSLNYASCYQLTDSSLQFLIGGLARLQTLRKLELVLASCYKLTSKTAESLVQLQDLQALSLNIENAGLMDETAIIHIAKALTRLTNLEMLNLNASYLKKLTNYEFCALGVALSGLSRLKYLCLDLGGYKEVTESGFVNFFRKLEALKKLTGLSLSLRYNTQTTDRSLSVLSIVTCAFQELKELKIDLTGSEMLTEKCYPKLVKVFAKFEDSKKVEIYL